MKNGFSILMLFLVLGVSAGTRKADNDSKKPAFTYSGNIQTGDIVLRNGKGFISDLFRNTSKREKKYSHAGIIVIENNKPFVYHMLGNASGGGEFKKEPLSGFCNPETNKGFAIYRYNFLHNKENEVNVWLQHINQKKPKFDEDFNLEESGNMYCSELIYNMCETVSDVHLDCTTVNERAYIGLDDLYLNKYTTNITHLNY
jgi:Permuted papain-like amidase enzyme, YaeF/YiiX, C92 family